MKYTDIDTFFNKEIVSVADTVNTLQVDGVNLILVNLAQYANDAESLSEIAEIYIRQVYELKGTGRPIVILIDAREMTATAPLKMTNKSEAMGASSQLDYQIIINEHSARIEMLARLYSMWKGRGKIVFAQDLQHAEEKLDAFLNQESSV